MNHKPALQQGVPREQIILAYAGEVLPEAAAYGGQA